MKLNFKESPGGVLSQGLYLRTSMLFLRQRPRTILPCIISSHLQILVKEEEEAKEKSMCHNVVGLQGLCKRSNRKRPKARADVNIVQFIPPQHSSALRAAGRALQTKVEANAATVVGLRAILRGFAMIDARCGPASIHEDTSDSGSNRRPAFLLAERRTNGFIWSLVRLTAPINLWSGCAGIRTTLHQTDCNLAWA